MAFEALKAQAAQVMDEIMRRPQDRHVLQEELREKISEIEALGMPVPEDLRQFLDELSQQAADKIYPPSSD